MEDIEPILTKQDLEWAICDEIPMTVMETNCWGTLVWDQCASFVKIWPNKCKGLFQTWSYSPNRFIQKLISGFPVRCKHWEEEYKRTDIDAHYSIWPKNNLKPTVVNPLLHSWWLYKISVKTTWCWSGLLIIADGWAKSHRKSVTYEGGTWWTCAHCAVNYCQDWIEKYSNETDYNILRQFKMSQLHVSHEHPLILTFLTNLPEEERKNCIGRFTKEGCLTLNKIKGMTDKSTFEIRYLTFS